ncbi:MarR family winged helix-turn-helix transcriptional regulator [Microlunatus ginsengisoli]|uniref:MarR family transcriptional regulator n=1 Tax=Microlunatus ginsengisoli TaxID=363863 RepID=A0ABP6ZNH1_9ACTN
METHDLTSTPGLASALRTTTLRLARRLRQMRADDLDLTGSQLSAMSSLLNHGDQLMGELAALERIQPPSMTRIVNALEERGMAVRKPSERDRRQCVVALTDAGREILLANRRRRDEWLARQMEGLDESDLDVLRRAVLILERVRNA